MQRLKKMTIGTMVAGGTAATTASTAAAGIGAAAESERDKPREFFFVCGQI
jgi:hypothetical protein